MIKEWMISNPKISIILLAFLITLITTLVTKYTTNQDRMKELKNIQKACQITLKDNKGNPKKEQEIQKEIMDCSMELLRHSLKPMLITMIPLIIFFWWVRGVYSPILPGWFWWYLGVGIASSILLRKVMDIA